MNIKTLKINSNFRYLWLKTVKDVDLSVHCAKCLIGEYDPRIKSSISSLENIELEDSIYYLCGVAYPFVWANNFHLAFRPCEGKNIEYSSNGISIEIENAEMLPISTEFIDQDNPKARFRSYYTCRNWQFANYFNAFLR